MRKRYSLWSRGRLLGHANLDFSRPLPHARLGDFEPTEVGERLLPVMTGVGSALRALYQVAADDRAKAEMRSQEPLGFSERVKQTAEYADAVSLRDELESLELELRDPDGTVVPTEWIAMQDTEYLLSLPDPDEAEQEMYDEIENDPELQAAIEHDIALLEDGFFDDDDDKPWEPPPTFARYLLMVMPEGAARLGAV